ncbi:MAG: ATP-dependent DNA helicase [Rubrivivax sp.]|nr:ATP-dependent DNA helicase [Betaproteobacteria bacterium]MBP6319109.1 ATP-dependent DNA helicase [Rubrivivax sp.]MBK7278842.1 ATP-dependent DNA helicase [Betaproteobacteria bacterium]MBK7518074.1 ATP-dependent DNA helicase [Betaproteobacteria bacterium]MBK8104452.1 ATP-dependent DNA helicase [Betaproteobacteria bacterium]
MNGNLAQAVGRAFAADGPLARSDPHFLARAAQDTLAARIAQAVAGRETLVAEAGTGVGKTFAYLVPLLLSGRRALISTATKSLQDQLFLRDLPRLRDALRVPVRMALLKGRASYLCRHRLIQARVGAQLPDRFAVRALHRVAQWAQATQSGDLAEIEGLDDRSPVIPLVTSTRDNCLGSECPEFRACHVMQARREAMAADLVVVNHHLFFADMALRDSGVAELLPTVDVAVFDEAHQLVEAGVQFLGTTLATGQAIDLGRDLLAAGLAHARGLQPWNDLQAGIERAARELRLACAGEQREVRGMLKRRWEERGEATEPALQGMADAALAAAQALAGVAEAAPDFPKLEQRARTLAALAALFGGEAAADHVRWIDLTPQQARMVESPLDIRQMLTEQRALAPRAWIFTSATLGDDEGLSWFTASTGLEDAEKLRVGSPFDYPAHARVWVPARFPLPNAPGHAAAVGALAARCAGALGGRTFVLTTTLRVLPVVADALAAQPEAAGLTVLVQGTEPRRALLQRYGDGRGCVLVGSASFWEGIDMPGDALQCVLIDKLPFPPPGDPLVEARVRQLRAQGRNPFDDYFVAEAAVSLKQGAGRLIRTETDRGLLVLCDPRLRQMAYGRRLLAALPPMGRLGEEDQALDWLAELAAGH